MWAALLDAVEGLFALAGAAACAMAVQAALTVPFAVTAARGLQGLRTSPLKFSHPDSAFLAASPLDARALVGLAACFQALGAGLAAGLGGFLLGAGLCSAGAFAASPFLVALAEGVAVMAGTVAAGCRASCGWRALPAAGRWRPLPCRCWWPWWRPAWPRCG